ncbi:hypothetical protein ACFPL7_24115 [Dongia soli]|uniref:Uncharacterized protein n=1 Tax=Dongia soli TaxID=600628 RepID=A0ABU5EGW2_9PROT|nr:hypothetical protein [Dongia soli]MDY0885390.1 hypothetical protein [Dongia soli]
MKAIETGRLHRITRALDETDLWRHLRARPNFFATSVEGRNQYGQSLQYAPPGRVVTIEATVTAPFLSTSANQFLIAWVILAGVKDGRSRVGPFPALIPSKSEGINDEFDPEPLRLQRWILPHIVGEVVGVRLNALERTTVDEMTVLDLNRLQLKFNWSPKQAA